MSRKKLNRVLVTRPVPPKPLPLPPDVNQRAAEWREFLSEWRNRCATADQLSPDRLAQLQKVRRGVRSPK